MRTCGYAARGMLHLQEYDESIRLFERMQELDHDLHVEDRIWLAGAFAGAGSLDQAIEQIGRIEIQRSKTRQVLDIFHRIPELVRLLDQPGISKAIARWR